MYPHPGCGLGKRMLNIINSKILYRLIKVLGLPSHSRQVLSMFKSLAHESHWTKAQIPCSYHKQCIYKDLMIPA
jgi:hypothetical protein